MPLRTPPLLERQLQVLLLSLAYWVSVLNIWYQVVELMKQIRHCYLPFVALAIGAMVPDTPLFFPVLDYAQTHSLWGVLTVCVPLGVSLFLLFEMVCRQPLLALSPTWLQQRIAGESQIPSAPQLNIQVSFYLGVAGAVAIGAISHQV